jgi:hypothetical protein
MPQCPKLDNNSMPPAVRNPVTARRKSRQADDAAPVRLSGGLIYRTGLIRQRDARGSPALLAAQQMCLFAVQVATYKGRRFPA